MTFKAEVIEAALRQERIEIARIIEAEADRHNAAAEAMEEVFDPDGEAFMHYADARMLHRIAETIRARTPAAPEPPEPKF